MSDNLRIAIYSSIFAGCGGLLPSLSNMAGKMISQDPPVPPNIWTLLPLGIFFFIGVVLNCAFNRTDWEIGKALVIGISAPGIITNLVSGANLNNNQSVKTTNPAIIQQGFQKGSLLDLFLGTAYAQEVTPAPGASQSPTPSLATSTPLLLSITLGGPYSASIVGLPVTTVIIANRPENTAQEIFRTDVAPVQSLIQVPKGTNTITFTVLSKNGNTFSSGALIPLPSKYFLAEPSAKPSSVDIILHSTTSGDVDVWWAFGSDRPPVITSVDATIDGISYLKTPRPAVCRTAANGIDRFQDTAVVEMTSGWRGGGSSQTYWCQEVINQLKANNPPSSEFKILGSSEWSRKTFFAHVEYNYTCQVQISKNPVFIEAPNAACGL